MSASLNKSILKWTLIITPWLLALALAVGWGIATWTPEYLEHLLPKLAEEMDLPLKEFQIRNAGLFSADIGPVSIGSKGTGIKLNNVSASYTPASLRQGRVNLLLVHGISLDCSYDGKTFTLPIADMIVSEDTHDSHTPGMIPELPFDELLIQDSTLHVDFLGRHMVIPFSMTVTPGEFIDFSGTLHLRDQAIGFTARQGPSIKEFSLTFVTEGFKLGSLADLLPVPIGGAMDLEMAADIDFAHPENLTSTIELAISSPDLSCLGVTLETNAILAANATISEQELDLAFAPIAIAAPFPTTLDAPKTHLSQDALRAEFTLTAAGMKLPGTLKADKDGEQWAVALDTANPNRLRVKTEGRDIRLGGLTLKVKGTATAASADVVVEAATKNIGLDGTELRTGPLNLRLPLAWPPPKTHTPGKLSVSSLRYGELKIGSFSTRLRQKNMGLDFGGTLVTQLLPNLRVPFSGHASMESDNANLTFGVDRYTLPDGYDPAKLVPALGGIKFSGDLNIEGGVSVSHEGIDTRLGVFLTDGTAVFGTSGTTMNGIRLYFESPDLINFRSAPAQMFAFDSLAAGGIEVENGVATFQVEPGGVVLVERARFNWCDGHVESRAFRVVPGHDDYDVTLFCTGLKLTKILHQLGLAKAKGDSALDGELPVTWNNGQISFNGGFLHSTPGQGGSIQVEVLDDLLASIPKGTPQHGQLELARHAVKDFEYKWVRIRADTVGKDLLVRLSVDGKPTGILPFVYRKEIGGFMMVEGDVEGSNFQGIRLDVNFNLPMDRILLYKDIIERIE